MPSTVELTDAELAKLKMIDEQGIDVAAVDNASFLLDDLKDSLKLLQQLFDKMRFDPSEYTQKQPELESDAKSKKIGAQYSALSEAVVARNTKVFNQYYSKIMREKNSHRSINPLNMALYKYVNLYYKAAKDARTSFSQAGALINIDKSNAARKISSGWNLFKTILSESTTLRPFSDAIIMHKEGAYAMSAAYVVTGTVKAGLSMGVQNLLPGLSVLLNGIINRITDAGLSRIEESNIGFKDEHSFLNLYDLLYGDSKNSKGYGKLFMLTNLLSRDEGMQDIFGNFRNIVNLLPAIEEYVYNVSLSIPDKDSNKKDDPLENCHKIYNTMRYIFYLGYAHDKVLKQIMLVFSLCFGMLGSLLDLNIRARCDQMLGDLFPRIMPQVSTFSLSKKIYCNACPLSTQSWRPFSNVGRKLFTTHEKKCLLIMADVAEFRAYRYETKSLGRRLFGDNFAAVVDEFGTWAANTYHLTTR